MVTTRGRGEGYFTIAGYSAIGEGYRRLASTPYWEFKAAGVLALVFAAGVAARSLTSWALGLALVAILGAVYGLVRAARIRVAVADSWLKGGHGEQLTAKRLAQLPKGWHVFHDLQVPIPDSRANLDHVVVGPAGLFLIDSKAWSGRLHRSTSSFEWLHDGQSLIGHQAKTAWMAEVLDNVLADRGAWVTTRWLWCVHGVALPRGGVLVNDGMAMVAPGQLVRWLRSRQDDQLDAKTVDEVALALRGLARPAVPLAAGPPTERRLRAL